MYFFMTNLVNNNLKITILKITNLLIYTLLFVFYSNTIFAQKVVNIACIGNGVTYGIGVENREKNNFPQQLQYLLGANYKVTNFGIVNAPVLTAVACVPAKVEAVPVEEFPLSAKISKRI